jgi:tRNA(fMet)-specific endonuclease VapC
MLSFDEPCAEKFGERRGTLRRRGIEVGPMDLMIAAAALVHDLTLVTHNTGAVRKPPDLSVSRPSPSGHTGIRKRQS